MTVVGQLKDWIQSQTFLTVKVIRDRGCSFFVHGKILSYDEVTNNILLYETDYKKIENIPINHIDEILPTFANR